MGVTAQTKDGLSAVYGINTRSRSGSEGLGNFDVLSQYIGIGSGYENWLWQVSLDYKQFTAVVLKLVTGLVTTN